MTGDRAGTFTGASPAGKRAAASAGASPAEVVTIRSTENRAEAVMPSSRAVTVADPPAAFELENRPAGSTLPMASLSSDQAARPVTSVRVPSSWIAVAVNCWVCGAPGATACSVALGGVISSAWMARPGASGVAPSSAGPSAAPASRRAPPSAGCRPAAPSVPAPPAPPAPEPAGLASPQPATVNPELARRMVFVNGGAFTSRAREFLDRVPNPRIDKPCDPGALRTLIAHATPVTTPP